MNQDSLPGAAANSRITNTFITEWRNRLLLRKISTVKSTIDSKPAIQMKCRENRNQRQQHIDQNNRILGQKLSEVHNRESQH